MRISDCPHPFEQRAFRENAYLEWMACLSCGARWSRKTGQDDIQVKMELTTDQPQMTPPCPGCASTTRLQQMANKTETFFGCSRFPLCKRVVHTSHTMESRVSPSTHSCTAAQPMAEQVMVLDSDSVGSEESFTMLNVPAESAVTPHEQQFLLGQLLHVSSSGITGQEARRAIVRMFRTKARVAWNAVLCCSKPRIHLFACTHPSVSYTLDCNALFVYKHRSTAMCFKHV